MESVGAIIKENRELCGINRRKLSVLSGISDSELMKIENGERKNPSWTNLCRIAAALEMNPIDFLLKTGYITQKDVNPAYMLKRIDKLEQDDLLELQLFIDFLISKKQSDMKGLGENNDI